MKKVSSHVMLKITYKKIKKWKTIVNLIKIVKERHDIKFKLLSPLRVKVY